MNTPVWLSLNNAISNATRLFHDNIDTRQSKLKKVIYVKLRKPGQPDEDSLMHPDDLTIKRIRMGYNLDTGMPSKMVVMGHPKHPMDWQLVHSCMLCGVSTDGFFCRPSCRTLWELKQLKITMDDLTQGLTRCNGSVRCTECGREYRNHTQLDPKNCPTLVLLCNGVVAKL